MSVRCSMRRLAALVLGVAGVVTLAPAPALSAREAPAETHCVLQVLYEKPSGEMVMAPARCYSTFAEAIADASGGDVKLDRGTPASALWSDTTLQALLSDFALGTHYDGFNGSGSSVTVWGSSCSGGWWNTSAAWDNRISSSWNGCQRLRHYQNPNKGGNSQDTYGSGTTDNLSTLNNDAESVAYLSS
jgi:hypothetical protein